MSELRYPENHEVKVEVRAIHVVIVLLSLLIIWPWFYYATDFSKLPLAKFLTLAGLNIDIIGVVVTTLKTPFYGHFHDGGHIEVIRATAEKRYFLIGMWFIAAGFFLQALGALFGQ